MTHDPTIHEDIGALKASFDSLNVRTNRIEGKLDEMHADVAAIRAELAGLKTRVAMIAGGIGTGVTLAASFVWDRLTKH